MNTEAWKIESIRMDGLLHRHNIYYKLHPKVNILGGGNGSGKSTILHALAYLLQRFFGNNEQKEIETHCEALFDSIEVELKSGEILNTQKVVTTTRELVDSQNSTGIKKNRIKFSENITFKESIKHPNDKVDSEPSHIVYLNSSDLAVRTISKLIENSLPDGRPGKTVLDVLLQDALNKRNQLFTAKIGGAIQNPGTSDIEYLKDLFIRFDKAVKRFMPEYVLKDTSTLTFSRNDDRDSDIMYFRLSTGEKQLLYLLLTVSNTMGENTILLLDEADMGLHIDWKRILLREILTINPNMQIIAATHSPSLIDGWYENVREVSQLYTDSLTENKGGL
ncbi:MAG: ATP-binding protein [Muribaculaceae bacterium]|nr:ATP-binding protein [Muribaculaceae bacterium]